MNANLRALLALCVDASRSGLRAVKQEALKLAKECLADYEKDGKPPIEKDHGNRGMFWLGDDRTIEACIDVLESELL